MFQKILNISLWIVGFGLMLSSSGLDGAFIMKLMPPGWGWLGLVLNTTTDIASEVISYWFGRLMQDQNRRKRTLALFLWMPQTTLVFYAWLFGWRQIIPILRAIEPEDWPWLAPLMAAFVPVALVAVGYTQALLAGRIEDAKKTQGLRETVQDFRETEKTAPRVVPAGTKLTALKRATITDWREICATLDGQRSNLTPEQVNQILALHGFAQKPESTARYWCKIAKQPALTLTKEN